MADEKKHTVKEQIDVLMYSHDAAERPITTTIDLKQFTDKLEDLRAKNAYKAFVSFAIELVKDKELGWGVLFVGEREETKEETAKREAMESAKRKTVEEAELKEFLRLKRKYGKKDEQGT